MTTENTELRNKLSEIVRFEKEYGILGVSFSVRNGKRIPIEAATEVVLSFLKRVGHLVATKSSWPTPELPPSEVCL